MAHLQKQLAGVFPKKLLDWSLQLNSEFCEVFQKNCFVEHLQSKQNKSWYKVTNIKHRKLCETCSKVTIKAPEQCHLLSVSYISVYLFLTLNQSIDDGQVLDKLVAKKFSIASVTVCNPDLFLNFIYSVFNFLFHFLQIVLQFTVKKCKCINNLMLLLCLQPESLLNTNLRKRYFLANFTNFFQPGTLLRLKLRHRCFHVTFANSL